MTHFVVETAGPRTLIEDAGRRGWADLGISGCGAWDRRAYLDGARLVGNGAGLGCLEILLGPVRLRCVGGPVLVAVTGADAQIDLDGAPRPSGWGFLVTDGQTVSIAMPATGLRSYFSVTGGINASPTFASVSADPTRGTRPSWGMGTSRRLVYRCWAAFPRADTVASRTGERPSGHAVGRTFPGKSGDRGVNE